MDHIDAKAAMMKLFGSRHFRHPGLTWFHLDPEKK